MSKRVFIIHGWGGSPDTDWHKWLKRELEKQKFMVEIPEMPDSFKPTITAWVAKLKEVVGKCNENTYLIGHSIGCQAIMRYVEKLNKNEKIGGIIFVAGWFNLTDEAWDETYTREIASPWLNTKIDFEKIKKHTGKIVDFYSEDDLYVPMSDALLFKERLNAKVISVGKKGHVNEEEGVTEVPFVVDGLMRMVNIR